MRAAASAIALASLMALPGAGCGKRPATPGPLLVAVSIAPQAYFVERIGEDLVEAFVLVPPGAAPEAYEPTVAQVEQLSSARLYVKVGTLGFDFESTLFTRIGKANRDLHVVDSADGVTLLDNNPHIWLSPHEVRVQVENICRGLIAVDPDHKEAYERNRDAFLSEIAGLDAEIRRVFAGLRHRVFLDYHPAWAYFARDYGLQEIAIEQEGKEPDPASIESAIRIARRKGVDRIYIQPQFDKKNARIIADAIGGEVMELNPLAVDWAGNLRRAAETLAEGMR